MATLREIRQKIRAVGHIQQITQAMELVAASRLRKAQATAELMRPYATKIKEILDRVMYLTEDEFSHPLLVKREVKKVGIVVIGSDRGLCGGYNQKIFRASDAFLQKYRWEVEVIPVGRKAVDYFRMKKWALTSQIENWGGKITYPEIENFTHTLMNFYLEGRLDEIWLLYTHFIHVGLSEVRLEKLLNIEITTSPPLKTELIFEPDMATIFKKILPRYCIIKMQTALNDAYASELAARISSMRMATKNAEKMGEKLTLERNKLRQSAITKELIEITSGAESIR